MEEKKEVSKVSKEIKEIFESDSNFTGFEETTNESFKLPLIKILEKLTPECDEEHPDYVKKAKPGKFLNTMNNRVYSELNIIVVKISHDLIAWAPNRQGFRGIHPKAKEQEIVDHYEGFQKYDKDGNELIDTISFYIINADYPAETGILPMSITRLKDARNFCNRLRSLKINNKNVQVTWAGVWKIKLIEYSNDKGKWHSIGNSPEFIRTITLEEKLNYIEPAIKLFKTAKIDYQELADTNNQKIKEEIQEKENEQDDIPF